VVKQRTAKDRFSRTLRRITSRHVSRPVGFGHLHQLDPSGARRGLAGAINDPI
jgi:hypothetical protein